MDVEGNVEGEDGGGGASIRATAISKRMPSVAFAAGGMRAQSVLRIAVWQCEISSLEPAARVSYRPR
jgi:hypothetical protein